MCIKRLIDKYREYNNNYLLNTTKYKYVPELYTPTSYYMFNLLNDIRIIKRKEFKNAMNNKYFDAYLYIKIPGFDYHHTLITLIIVFNRYDLYEELNKKYLGIIHNELFDHEIPTTLLNYDKVKYKKFIDNI